MTASDQRRNSPCGNPFAKQFVTSIAQLHLFKATPLGHCHKVLRGGKEGADRSGLPSACPLSTSGWKRVSLGWVIRRDIKPDNLLPAPGRTSQGPQTSGCRTMSSRSSVIGWHLFSSRHHRAWKRDSHHRCGLVETRNPRCPGVDGSGWAFDGFSSSTRLFSQRKRFAGFHKCEVYKMVVRDVRSMSSEGGVQDLTFGQGTRRSL